MSPLAPPLEAFHIKELYYGPKRPAKTILSWSEDNDQGWVAPVGEDIFEEILERGPGPRLSIRGLDNDYEFTWDGANILETATLQITEAR